MHLFDDCLQPRQWTLNCWFLGLTSISQVTENRRAAVLMTEKSQKWIKSPAQSERSFSAVRFGLFGHGLMTSPWTRHPELGSLHSECCRPQIHPFIHSDQELQLQLKLWWHVFRLINEFVSCVQTEMLCLFLFGDDSMSSVWWLNVGQCVQVSCRHSGTGDPERLFKVLVLRCLFYFIHSVSLRRNPPVVNKTSLKGSELKRLVNQLINTNIHHPHISAAWLWGFSVSLYLPW